jgi:predicted esterase
MIQQADLNFSFKARYYKLGEINEHTKQVWFVIHGYGQLAQYFIRKFSALENQGVCVIAPEGLSRFYLSELQEGGIRGNDKVGATWMTKENRLTDIENYVTYLNEIYDKEIPQSFKSVSVLGFSQGAATASRWVMANQIHFNRLILWAGAFPPDMNFEEGKEVLKSKEVVQVYGTNDPFINGERLAELSVLNAKLGIRPTTLTFEGKHEIDEPTLLKLI